MKCDENQANNLESTVNRVFMEKAESLKPVLFETKTAPANLLCVKKDPKGNWYSEKEAPFSALREKILLQNDTVYLDFGGHQVGYLTLRIAPVGCPADSPAHLRLRFGETLREIMESPEEYHGWLSESWIQDERIHIDAIPATYHLPRRYAFRYCSVEVLNSTAKYQVRIKDVFCTQVTSADMRKVPALKCKDPQLRKIYAVGIRTLRDCMQTVFEDGPKRDRRLWVGDLRLEALADYATFKNYDLVRRCLYLFAGMTGVDGRVSAYQYVEPETILGDNVLYDYSLFFIVCLYDYYQETHDDSFVRELWGVAWRQIELSLERLDSRSLVKDSDDWWCFLDWGDGLNKQAGAQAILIYTLRMAKVLAALGGTCEQKKIIVQAIRATEKAAVDFLWDENSGLFVSGSKRQVSSVSQIWMILARVMPDDQNRQLCERVLKKETGIPLVTPYMHHYFVEAMLQCGMKTEAARLIKDYWGGMIRNGTDTYWEIYDPENPEFSPYGSPIVNSYCHAWSCTPTYFIRKYFQDRE